MPVEFTVHATKRMVERVIKRQDILETIQCGQVVQQSVNRKIYLHEGLKVVTACVPTKILVITVYGVE